MVLKKVGRIRKGSDGVTGADLLDCNHRPGPPYPRPAGARQCDAGWQKGKQNRR
jgi:hypothetical protein